MERNDAVDVSSGHVSLAGVGRRAYGPFVPGRTSRGLAEAAAIASAIDGIRVGILDFSFIVLSLSSALAGRSFHRNLRGGRKTVVHARILRPAQN